VLHARDSAEVEVDVLLRGAAVDAELACETERRHAIDQAEIDRLRGTPLVRRHMSGIGAEYLGSRREMDFEISANARSRLRRPTDAP
jgi:hypothetical protein